MNINRPVGPHQSPAFVSWCGVTTSAEAEYIVASQHENTDSIVAYLDGIRILRGVQSFLIPQMVASRHLFVWTCCLSRITIATITSSVVVNDGLHLWKLLLSLRSPSTCVFNIVNSQMHLTTLSTLNDSRWKPLLSIPFPHLYHVTTESCWSISMNYIINFDWPSNPIDYS